jgi:hypothetical protein
MQSRLTVKVLFPLVVLYFKTFQHVGAHGTEIGLDERFYKNQFLKRGNCCWGCYYVERYPVNFPIRMLKVKPKMKSGFPAKVARPFTFL